MHKEEAAEILKKFIMDNSTMLGPLKKAYIVDDSVEISTPKNESWGVYLLGDNVGVPKAFLGILYKNNSVFFKLWERGSLEKRADWLKSQEFNDDELLFQYNDYVGSELDLEEACDADSFKIQINNCDDEDSVQTALSKLVPLYVDFCIALGAANYDDSESSSNVEFDLNLICEKIDSRIQDEGVQLKQLCCRSGYAQYMPKDGSNDVWNIQLCHYELLVGDTGIMVCFHCESGYEFQVEFAKVLSETRISLPPHWKRKDKSWILFDKISLNDDECVSKCTDSLISSYNKYGDIINNLIKLSKEGHFLNKQSKNKDFVNLLMANRNIILHGAPGTGKTYLAKEIASEMIFGVSQDKLTDEQNKQFNEQVDFVQFHQSYDYTDFVEGLRPLKKEGKSDIFFEKVDGVFKSFCESALKNLKNANDVNASKENSLQGLLDDYLGECEESEKEFSMKKGSVFKIDHHDDRYIYIENSDIKRDVKISVKDMIRLLDVESIKNVIDVKKQFGRTHRQKDSYMYSFWKDFKNSMPSLSGKKEADKDCSSGKCELRNYVFIIDEINRGEMSKIFGELFYSIDPGYRVSWQDLEDVQSGKSTQSFVRTQYANMESDSNEWDDALHITDVRQYGHFFVPENVYIIGTMNDIDRSVESMDFAMRRRFAFKEVKAEDRVEMLNKLKCGKKEEAVDRMQSLNAAIEKIDGLSSAYHIGPAYFLKLDNYDGNFAQLWEYHIEGVLREYLRGMEDAEGLLEDLHKAYNMVPAEA